MRLSLTLLAALASTAMASPAFAGSGDPIEISEGVTLDPILDLRLRVETAEQSSFEQAATSVTFRVRTGATLSYEGFTLLAEGEGNVTLERSFNDTLPRNGVEPFPVIADPETLELNRLHIGYQAENASIVLGRQRIIHDDARFVGNVVWRQNEQTYDAVRLRVTQGPLMIDGTYAISQRTIFGSNSPRTEFEGDFLLSRAALELGPVDLVAFHYALDYEDRLNFSSETLGASASLSIPVGPASFGARLRYATQSDNGDNPLTYQADYWLAEGSLKLAGFTARAQYEELGSDEGLAAFQTPLATAHKFNGFADLFLVTPASGLADTNFSLARTITVPGLPGGISVKAIYHDFDSAIGRIDFGDEIDFVASFKINQLAFLVKYADYDANSFAVDTERLTIQLGLSF